ncbi:MAG: hypothetical protein O6649_02950 [Gammaproteobacteria bacterium]|nr:hypothetical protein [Gammaproteobacteria bacterium]MCZ6668979.1 hypothetical protein [Gammaproteobacteria bacterium]
MPDTLVLQSHRQPLPYPWIESCLESVSRWSENNSFDYRFIGDELFDSVPAPLLEKTAKQKIIATDLARLRALQDGLRQGYATVIWCDADFLIFNPVEFVLPDCSYTLGREVWVQVVTNNRLKAYSKVHNAFMMFRAGNSFLNFYAETAERLLHLNCGQMPPQFIGPKLLTALHNIAICPVMETAGMLSPLVIRDLIKGQGAALDMFRRESPVQICAANLSSSLVEPESISNDDMRRLIEVLAVGGVGKQKYPPGREGTISLLP